MNKIDQYLLGVTELLKTVQESQKEAIEKAADAAAAALENDGMIFTFGTGHSHMLAEEIFYRAGGLVRVHPILDDPLLLHINATRSSTMERLCGYAATLLEGLTIKPGDVMFIFSNSGRNAVPIEMAQEAKERGMCVICITNLRHSNSVTSRHPSGKRLYDFCDIVIDNCGVVGDASVEIGDLVCGPTSTVIGTALLQAIVCGTVERLQEKGIVPEVFCSSNVDGNDEKNHAYLEKYKGTIRFL